MQLGDLDVLFLKREGGKKLAIHMLVRQSGILPQKIAVYVSLAVTTTGAHSKPCFFNIGINIQQSKKPFLSQNSF